MTPKINEALDKSNYELVRDQIAAILTTELGNQATLQDQLPEASKDQDLVNVLKELKIVTERYAEFSETDYPVVDIFLFQNDFDNKDRAGKRGNVQYYLDVYMNGPKQAIDGDKGDAVSAKRAQRIAGMINNILEHPAYITLGFTPPPAIIHRTLVSSIKRPEEESSPDASNVMQYRIIFDVVMSEEAGSIDGTLIGQNTTTVRIGETNVGYVWEYVAP